MQPFLRLVILVYGSSNAGKTSLINLLTESNEKVGSGQLKGCTYESKNIKFIRNNQIFILLLIMSKNKYYTK